MATLRIKTQIISEVAISLLLGSAPVILVLILGDVEEVGEFISNLALPNSVIYYYFSLSLFYPLAWVIDHITYPEYRRLKYGVAFFVYCLKQAGANTLGIYRIVGGTMLAFSTLWFAFDLNYDVFIKAGRLFVFGAMCVFTAYILSWFHNLLSRHISDPLEKLQNDVL